MKTRSTSFKQVNRIVLGQIIFDQSEWVTIWGGLEENGRIREMNFIIEFDTLNRLLRLSGRQGDDIQMQLVERLEQGTENPSVVDLERIFGKKILLDQCYLKGYHPQYEVPVGGCGEDTSCLLVEEVQPLLEQKRFIRRPRNQAGANIDVCLQLLSRSYELYLGYLELELDETEAMQKAELTDDVKFKLAYYAWKSQI